MLGQATASLHGYAHPIHWRERHPVEAGKGTRDPRQALLVAGADSHLHSISQPAQVLAFNEGAVFPFKFGKYPGSASIRPLDTVSWPGLLEILLSICEPSIIKDQLEL